MELLSEAQTGRALPEKWCQPNEVRRLNRRRRKCSEMQVDCELAIHDGRRWAWDVKMHASGSPDPTSFNATNPKSLHLPCDLPW